MPYRALVLFHLLLCSFVFSYAREKAYTIVNYNTDNGLPQNSVTAIQFDRKGYCWLGTQMGLVRFDGQRFTVFGSDNVKGLRSDRIYNVTQDVAGNIFAGTGGILEVLRINDATSLYAPVPSLQSQPSVRVSDQGIATPSSIVSGLKYDSTMQIEYGTAQANLYLIQSDGSYYITPHQINKISVKEPISHHNALVTGESFIVLKPNGTCSVWTNGLLQNIKQLAGPLRNNKAFQKGNFATLSDVNGYVYAGTSLYQLHIDNGKLISELLLDNINIPAVSSAYFERKSNKWYIGSSVSGLFVLTPSDFYTPPVPDFSMVDGFRNQAVTNEGILNQDVLYRRDGSIKKYPLVPQSKAIWYDSTDKNIYYTPNAILQRTNVVTGATKVIYRLSSYLSSIYPDPLQKSNLIFSTSFSLGKVTHDTILSEKSIPGVTKGKELFASYPLGNDSFLLATWSGVKWYDWRRNKVYRTILDALTIHQLYAESPEHVWIASYGKGWYLYNNGSIHRLPDGPSAALKTVNAIIDDGRGFFWLSSNNGLYKVNKQALLDYAAGKSEDVYFYTFSTKDHLPTNEFNSGNPSYVWLPDSMLSLPSLKGLVWFYPHQIRLSLPNQGIYLEHIYVDEQERDTNKTLVLNPNHGRLKIIVSSPYFGNPENMQLQFKVEGLEKEWHPVPSNGEIIVDRIPAGTFSLVVRKNAGMEASAYTQLVLPIRVNPFWYQSTPFYLFLLCLSLALVYWIITLRTRILQARNRKLKMQVTLQTRDLHRMVNRLQQSEEALKQSNQAKNNIITTVLHDLRSPIRFLHTISKWVANDHQRMKPDALSEHLEELKNGTASLNSFTEQFFTWALSQHDSFTASYSHVALQLLFKKIETLYADIVQANGNRLIVAPTEIYLETDGELLSTVIRNLLDNANKNTTNGLLKLAAYRTEENTIITVSDTGKGFEPGQLQLFLDKTKTDRRKGNGSFIMLQLLDVINGSLVADSEPGKGTSFNIIIPHRNAAHDNTPGDSILPPTESSAFEKPGL